MLKKAGLTLFLLLCFSSMGYPGKIFNKPSDEKQENKLPIVYSKHYNISLFGIENLHPFDSRKYGRTYKYLKKRCGLSSAQFYTPAIATDEDLLSIHTTDYLDSLGKSLEVARIAELGILVFFPNFILRSRLLKPMRYAVGGTVLAARLAFEYGWSINLSGGYHHAKRNSGGGFCFYADVPIALYKLFQERPELKSVLLVDLDAHQGNGFESIFADDPRIHIFDIYNASIYPYDTEAKKYIDFEFPVKIGTADDTYLSILEDNLPAAISKTKPDLIIYNAGTDIFQKDPLGALSLTAAGIVKRDEIVFAHATRNSIPVVMLLSGGYTKESYAIIGMSIKNLLANIIKNTNRP